MLSPNTILRDRYRIISQLGQGGMGTVYQAMDENLSRVVAVKETLATTPEQRSAFKREAELLANLSHPALPTVTEHFEYLDGQFLVMQFVPGHDLAELLDLREQPFAEATVLAWADQILDALDDLHSFNPPIIHRDIKPSNLKVTPKGKIMLLDLGLAKGVAGQMSTLDKNSQVQSIYGYTPSYAPLEQIRGGGTDARSDLYALAATLWTLLTGHIPADALTRVVEKEEGNSDPLRPAREINPRISEGVSSVLAQTLSLNRNQRSQSAAEFRRALRDAGDPKLDQPTLQKPPFEGREPSLAKVSPPPGSTISSPEGEVTPSVPSGKHVPTMRVDAPLPLALWDRQAGAPTSSSSAPSEQNSQAKKWRVSLTVVGGLVVALLVIVAFIWRPWSNPQLPNQPAASGATELTSTSEPSPSLPRSVVTESGIELVWIPPGQAVIGSNNGVANEKPIHAVTMSEGFYIGKYEVTQAQWQSVMGYNPSYFKGRDLPVEQISWDDAMAFIKALNRQDVNFIYRLPSEAEWEYACRAGTTGDYAGELETMAWYGANSGRSILNTSELWARGADNYLKKVSENGNQTHAVGTKSPNAFGVHDMYGNVWEWCEDWYHDSYAEAPADGTAWLNGGEKKYRVPRGGSWLNMADVLRSAYRNYFAPNSRYSHLGVRVVAVARHK